MSHLTTTSDNIDSINSTVALAAFLSTALISVAPNVLLLLFPQYASGEGESSFVLSLGQAIAAGGLLGDVFLHVIPHSAAATAATASSSTSHHGGHDSSMGLCILLGFGIFLITDMVLRQFSSTSNNSHSHNDNNNNNNDDNDNDKKTISRIHVHEHSNHSHKKSLVRLNLAADALHNVSVVVGPPRTKGKFFYCMHMIVAQTLQWYVLPLLSFIKSQQQTVYGWYSYWSLLCSIYRKVDGHIVSSDGSI
jgi:hypothetical protein